MRSLVALLILLFTAPSWASCVYDPNHRVIVLSGLIDDTTTQQFFVAMHALETSGDGPIVIKINSYGGEVYNGLAIHDLIDLSPSKVCVYGYGAVMSMAAVVFQGGDERMLAPNATMMIHEGSTQIASTSITGASMKMEEVERLESRFIRILGKRMRKRDKELRELLREDQFYSADEAVRVGLADRIVEEGERPCH